MSSPRSDRLRDVVADAGLAVSTKGAQMARDAHHERLSSLDATFLGVEDRCSHMHIGSVGVFEAGPGSAIDLERVHHVVAGWCHGRMGGSIATR